MRGAATTVDRRAALTLDTRAPPSAQVLLVLSVVAPNVATEDAMNAMLLCFGFRGGDVQLGGGFGDVNDGQITKGLILVCGIHHLINLRMDT